MKYTKQNIEKQRKVLSSDKVRKNSSVSLFLFKYVFYCFHYPDRCRSWPWCGICSVVSLRQLHRSPKIPYIPRAMSQRSMIIKVRQSKLYQTMILTEFILLCHPSPKISSMHLLPLRMNGFTAIMVLICTGSFELPSLVFVTNH